MENHGLGHLPQPDNFTTIGNNLGLEISQYNCPINVIIFTTETCLPSHTDISHSRLTVNIP